MPSALMALCEENPLVTIAFPTQWANNAEFLCFLWYEPAQTVEQTVELLVIWDAMNDAHAISV